MKCLRNARQRLIGTVSLAITAIALTTGAYAQEAVTEQHALVTDPVTTVVTLQRALVAAAALDDVEARFAALLPEIRATHDLRGIARLTIRRDFDQFAPEEQAAFIAAFERLSVMNYAARFTGLSQESFRNVGSKSIGSDRAEVESFIRNGAGEEISLDYVLEHSVDGWRIINIVADGVSDLALKRAEYRAILASGTAADLIAAIEAQAEALAEG